MLPRTHYGTFYDAEAYLIYSSSLSGQPAGPDVIVRINYSKLYCFYLKYNYGILSLTIINMEPPKVFRVAFDELEDAT